MRTNTHHSQSVVCSSYLDMVFWMRWRCGLPEDSAAATAVVVAAAAPEAFPAPLELPFAFSADFKVGEAETAPAADGPGPSAATVSCCPTAAMALILSLGRVLVEPME